MTDVLFVFEGQRFRVPEEAYESDVIQLPSGKMIAVEAWQESKPPQPLSFLEIHSLGSDEIAAEQPKIVAAELICNIVRDCLPKRYDRR